MLHLWASIDSHIKSDASTVFNVVVSWWLLESLSALSGQSHHHSLSVLSNDQLPWQCHRLHCFGDRSRALMLVDVVLVLSQAHHFGLLRVELGLHGGGSWCW